MAELRFDVGRGGDVARIRTDLLIVTVREGQAGSVPLRRIGANVEKALLRRARQVGFRGQEGRTLLHWVGGAVRAVLLVGVGKLGGSDPEAWRRAGGAAAKAAAGEGAETLAALLVGAKNEDAVVFAEGAALARYRFNRYRKPERETKPEPRRLTLFGSDLEPRSLRRELRILEATVPAVFAARDLVNEPPSVASADFIARRAVELCRRSGVRVEVMGPAQIRRLELNGLLAVNRGSEEEPRFIRIRYRPRRRAKLKVALVGKGITFDSGGLSLKPAGSMETMKHDMAGAAAVIGTMSAIGRLRPAVEVTAYIPSTDNLPSGSAQKPGDVIRYRNGKTVEVLNTDAEGRLVLADALALACDEGNQIVVDLATLTGACRVALGTRVAGIMGNDEALVERLVALGRETGEAIWPLPLVREYRDELKSSVADLKNVGGGLGGAITAGLFLQEFVDGVKWAHLDIAGPAFAEKELAYCPRGGTGFGVRTLVRYLMAL